MAAVDAAAVAAAPEYRFVENAAAGDAAATCAAAAAIPPVTPASASVKAALQAQAAASSATAALGTGPSKCLGLARSWDRPLKMLGTGPLLG